ncbi:hypothetical protein [Palleronia caenipelagi]|uniref:Phage tail protein n=1 Tax=Palleronia caenipelagi TaxID=2489174 RepID=A0A547Q6B6_9RHOB|nr:hypothetical protein [Palleronia caenipelagi]TRD21911.1 hypothetical protein FEV53_07630 [Palleronia caenipelagi]
MGNPTLAYRGDILVMVAFDPEIPNAFVNFCGATGISLEITNEILSEKIGDCEDWSASIQTIKAYGAQDSRATFNGKWAQQNHGKVLRWVLDQKMLPVRVHFVTAGAGDVEYIDGIALATSTELGDIGNVEGNSISRNLSLEFSGKLTLTDKAA